MEGEVAMCRSGIVLLVSVLAHLIKPHPWKDLPTATECTVKCKIKLFKACKKERNCVKFRVS